MSFTMLIVLTGSSFAAEPLPRPIPSAESSSIHQPLRVELISGRQLGGADAPQLPPGPAVDEFPAPPPPPPEALEEDFSPTAVPVAPTQQMGTLPLAGCYADGTCLYPGSDMQDGMSPGCPTCFAGLEDDTKVCKLHSTCDLYPHYAYYPKYHGYYYFRPYNYTMIAGHQQFAACIGLDPRMPYSLENFNRIYSAFPIQFTPARSPVGTAMPTGSGLPELESLLDK